MSAHQHEPRFASLLPMAEIKTGAPCHCDVTVKCYTFQFSSFILTLLFKHVPERLKQQLLKHMWTL